ncbi:MAG: cbb3-type cytochrome oxidase assembly protein CcoH [Idiomarinaceae bacterium HL-53]|nr:MAG: cbb3-type cytochrome oxidase assembly protein CcoH [Idiomarinaceae bacterium HL-53]CUS48985.1 hypothetical protein Ga0003345_1966 [Idiomarinaceae bacterium HL-53]
MSMVETNRSTGPWYKHFWPWFIVTLIGSVIIACFVTAVIIYKNPTSMVVDDYYNEGRTINLRLDKAALAIELGVVLEAQFSEDQLALRFIEGNVDDGTALQVNFYHPTLDRQDFQLRMTRAADGVYRAMLPRAIDGHWRIDIGPFDERWEVSQNIHLPAPGTIRLEPVDYGVQTNE